MVHVTLPDPDGPNALTENKLRWTKDVVIYDGDCRFCSSQVERLQRYDSEGKLAFISLHDPRIQERFPELTYEDMMRQMYVVAPDGRKYGGAAAVRYLSRRLPKLYWLMPIMHIPFSLPVWQWLYGQVAKRRYKLAGKTCDGDSCAVHFKK
jgi:predicted DCC family thiol-disulfide oxidoreductase YuxK